jgi:hypothetical protein
VVLAALAVVTVAFAASAESAKVQPWAVCLHRGYVDLFPQDGAGTAANPSTTFSQQGDCIRWIRSGGAVGTLRPELIPDSGTMHFWLTISGAAPVGTTGVCAFDPDLPLLVSYILSGAGTSGSGCLNPPAEGEPFQVLVAPCTTGELVEVTVAMASASGGVVARTVVEACV